MRFYRGTDQYYCGIDLHAKTMHRCVSDQHGTILLHETRPAARALIGHPLRRTDYLGLQALPLTRARR